MDNHNLYIEDLINENYITLYNTIDDYNKLLHQLPENELIVSEQIKDKSSADEGTSTNQWKSLYVSTDDKIVAVKKLHPLNPPILPELMDRSSFTSDSLRTSISTETDRFTRLFNDTCRGDQLQKSGNMISDELEDTTSTFSDAIDTSDLTDTSTSSYFSSDQNTTRAVFKNQHMKELNFKRKLHKKLQRLLCGKENGKLDQEKLSEGKPVLNSEPVLDTSSENYQSFDSDSCTSSDEEDDDKLKANQSIKLSNATEPIEEASNYQDKFSKTWSEKQKEEILSKLNEEPLLSFLKFVKNMPNDSCFYNYDDPRTPNCSLDNNEDDEFYYASNEESFHEVPQKYNTALEQLDIYKSISEKSFNMDSSSEDLRFSLFL